jgi:ElaB/YqjD/DUF883 family membrane-anchored ribosome-binding protein
LASFGVPAVIPQAQEYVMRNSATHSGKDLAKEIALLKAQLDDLSDSVNGAGNSIVARGQEALEETLHSARELIAKYGDTAKSIAKDTVRLKNKATDTLIEHTEARPLTTLAAIVGIGFLAGWLFRRH